MKLPEARYRNANIMKALEETDQKRMMEGLHCPAGHVTELHLNFCHAGVHTVSGSGDNLSDAAGQLNHAGHGVAPAA